MRIGILGGTYNPPHLGHRHMADMAIASLDLDELLVIPAARPPHKSIPDDAPDDYERMEMVKINFAGMKKVTVSDIEFAREGPSYSADTISHLLKQRRGAEIFLILGTDMFLQFENWHRFEDILKMSTLAVFARERYQRREIEEHRKRLQEMWAGKIRIVDNEIIPISSTELRGLLARREGTAYMSERLYAYIIRKRLYGAKPNLEWLRPKALSMLNGSRIAHVIGCEHEAARLANRWGADKDDAREAALLHDITKNRDMNQQLILCEIYGIITDSAEKNNEKLLHAKTGAEVGRDLFGIHGAVYDAIFWHTTGRCGMGLLEQIIYLADYIEPNRCFDGVEKLRELAYKDLRAAMSLGLKMSIDDLVQSETLPHRHTVEALKWLKNLED